MSSITTAEDASSPDSPMHYLYLDPQENAPVMELVTARAGDEDGEEPRGDFRLSNKARVVEFYNPFCVSSLFSIFVVCRRVVFLLFSRMECDGTSFSHLLSDLLLINFDTTTGRLPNLQTNLFETRP